MLPAEQREEIRQLVEASNEKLASAAASGSEQAFGLGCLVVALPLAGVALVLFFLGVLNLIAFFVSLAMIVLAGVGVAALIAYRARGRAIGETYRRTIYPEIEGYLQDNSIQRQQFDRLADEVLPPDAPLRGFIDARPAHEVDQHQE